MKAKYAEEAVKIKYLTRRKKQLTVFERWFSCCIIKKDNDSSVDSCSSDTDDSDDPTKPPPENYKLIDMLIFKEENRAWQIYDVFINVLSAISSYFYLFYASSRNAVGDDEFAKLYYPM